MALFTRKQPSVVHIRWVDSAWAVTIPMGLKSEGLQKEGRGMVHVPLLPTIVKVSPLIFIIQYSTVPLFLKMKLSTCLFPQTSGRSSKSFQLNCSSSPSLVSKDHYWTSTFRYTHFIDFIRPRIKTCPPVRLHSFKAVVIIMSVLQQLQNHFFFPLFYPDYFCHAISVIFLLILEKKLSILISDNYSTF